MNFHTCGVCGLDVARKDCVPLEELKKELEASDIKEMFMEMLEPLSNTNATKYEKAFARAAQREMKDGILLQAVFACCTCARQLKTLHRRKNKCNNNDTSAGGVVCGLDVETAEGHTSDVDEDENEDENEDDENEDEDEDESREVITSVKRNVPVMALVNGHFRGTTPLVLSRLTRVELSMVCLVNCIYTLSMLKRGSHWGSTATVFSVLNDVNAIASHLPRIPSLGDIALIRSAVDSTSPRDFLYSPNNVIQALLWLENNNPLWEGKFVRPPGNEWVAAGSRNTMEVECIDAEAEDFEDLDSELNGSSGTDGHAVNPNAPPSNMSEVLLTGSRDQQALLRQIENSVGKRYVRLRFKSVSY
jgi:hypothetical protein